MGPTQQVSSRKRRPNNHPYYVARRRKVFIRTKIRKERAVSRVPSSGALIRRAVGTQSVQPKVVQYDTAARRTFFETLRSLQLNENATPTMVWEFVARSYQRLPPFWTDLTLDQRSLLLEALHAYLKESFLADPMSARSAFNLFNSKGIMDETEWVLCIATMAKSMYQALRGIEENTVERRLRTVFDVSIPLYFLMRTWESLLKRNEAPSRTPNESAADDTEPRRSSPNTTQLQHDGQSYENSLLAQCGLKIHDMNDITARRIVTASLMTVAAMTSWLSQLRPDSRFDLNTGGGEGPNEGFNSEQQFDVRTISQREFSFLHMVIFAVKGGPLNAIMLKVGLANTGLSPQDIDQLVASLRRLQEKSDALEARFRSSLGVVGNFGVTASQPHTRAAQAIVYAIKQTTDTNQLARITDTTHRIHATHPNFNLDHIMFSLCRRYWTLNDPKGALDLWINNKSLHHSRSLVKFILAHYIENNDVEGFEYICRIVDTKIHQIPDDLSLRYWQLAGPERAVVLWRDNTALRGSLPLLRSALHHYFDQKDLDNFEQTWGIGTRRFRKIPEDLQQRRVEIMISHGRLAVAEAATYEWFRSSQSKDAKVHRRLLQSISVQVWNAMMGRLLHAGNKEQAESYLRLLENLDGGPANADTYRLFMCHCLATRDLQVAEEFAEKLYRKGELPDDADASRYLLCSLENLHVVAKRPTPSEIYSAIQTAFDFRYRTKFLESVPCTPIRMQKHIEPTQPDTNLYQHRAILPETRTPISAGHTYLAMLRVILDEGFNWDSDNRKAIYQSTTSDKDNNFELELRGRPQYVEKTHAAYTRSQRVRDALMLDNFRRHESGLVTTVRVSYNETLLQGLFTLPRTEQLALLSGDHIRRGSTHGIEYHYIWDCFGSQFLLKHLQQFQVPRFALRVIGAMKMKSFGSITRRNLIDAGIHESSVCRRILEEAAMLHYQLWSIKLGGAITMVKNLAEAIENSKLEVKELVQARQMWRTIASRVKKLSRYSRQGIERAELEFQSLKAGKIVEITPFRPPPHAIDDELHDTTLAWWRYRLRQVHHWLRTSDRDIEQCKRELRNIRANQPPSVLLAPVQEAPGFLLYKPHAAATMAPRRATRIVA